MMRPPANKARIAVVDTETTGLSRTDRIVEFACVTVVNGEQVPLPTLENLERQVGIHPVKSVTKRSNLVVADYIRSRSGKARKGRDLGLPIVDATRFITLIAKGEAR